VYGQLKSVMELATRRRSPHPVVSAFVTISEADPYATHESQRRLPEEIATLVRVHFPDAIKLDVLTGVFAGFQESLGDMSIDFTFGSLENMRAQHVPYESTVMPVKFKYEDFLWRATVRHVVVKEPNEETGDWEWVSVIHIQLPNDSYIYTEDFIGKSVGNHTVLKVEPNTDRGKQAATLVKSFVDFLAKHGLSVNRQVRRSLTSTYDKVEQRFSLAATFPGNKRFEIDWEYGYHERAVRLSEKHLRCLELHSEELLSLISLAPGSAATSNTSS